MREFDDELRFHLESRIEANLRRGMSPGGGRSRGSASSRQHAPCPRRHARGSRQQPLRRRGRRPRQRPRVTSRKPWLSTMVVATLSLGIGASAAMFSLLNAALFRPLPFHDADRLVAVNDAIRGAEGQVSPIR